MFGKEFVKTVKQTTEQTFITGCETVNPQKRRFEENAEIDFFFFLRTQ